MHPHVYSFFPQLPLEAFHYLTRIHYRSDNVPSDGTWGEHEIDYILFIQRDVDVNINQNEVQSYRYVSQEQLKQFMGGYRSNLN